MTSTIAFNPTKSEVQKVALILESTKNHSETPTFLNEYDQSDSAYLQQIVQNLWLEMNFQHNDPKFSELAESRVTQFANHHRIDTSKIVLGICYDCMSSPTEIAVNSPKQLVDTMIGAYQDFDEE